METPTLTPAAAAAVALFDGMTVQHMGGGCFALHMETSDAGYMLITSQEEECYAPQRMNEPVLVGHYWYESDDDEHLEFPTLADALRDLWGNSEGETLPAELTANEG